jgi:hypothetical protein
MVWASLASNPADGLLFNRVAGSSAGASPSGVKAEVEDESASDMAVCSAWRQAAVVNDWAKAGAVATASP